MAVSHDPDDAVDVSDSTLLTDLAETDPNLRGFATVAEETGLKTVGDLRDATLEGFVGDARDVIEVGFWGTWGGPKCDITIEETALGPEDTYTIGEFAEKIGRGDLPVMD